MDADGPQIKDDELYRLLRDGRIDEFNQRRDALGAYDLRRCDFRTVDLRGMHADALDLRDCYFRQADLRGVDLTQANLEGASIHNARISGAYFPSRLRADEIMLSLTHGTRLRYTAV